MDQTSGSAVSDIEIDTGSPSAPAWHSIKNGSTGLRATALLLLTLATAEGPVLLDAPGAMLDAHTVSEILVPILRERKMERQIIAVAGDGLLALLAEAEHVIGVDWETSAVGGTTKIDPEQSGSLDSPKIRALLESSLAGARIAFEALSRRKEG